MKRQPPQFSFIAAGYLCVAANVYINGYELLLPNTVGYALIYFGLRQAHARQALFSVGAGIAFALAVLSFPDFFRLAYRESFQSYDAWTFWPRAALESLLALLIAGVVWREASRRGSPLLKVLAIATAPVLAIALIAWAGMLPTSDAAKVAAFLTYEAPAFYLSAVSAVAAKRLTSRTGRNRS